MVAIIDYGVGNLFSLKSSLDAIGVKSIITSKKEEIENADKVILPGVGAFEDAMKKLVDSGLDKVVIDLSNKGKYVLGICLGMQLLFEKSYEYGTHKGLGIIKGEVIPIPSNGLKIPHMGWNYLKFNKESRLFKYIKEDDYVYFVHSFWAKTKSENMIAYTDYGVQITASVEKNNTFGCQFHPEKSGNVGLNILKAFCDME